MQIEQESSLKARLEQSLMVVTDTDVLPGTKQSSESAVQDTSMRDRQVERSYSSETQQSGVV